MKLDKSREMFERSKRSLAGGLSSWVRSKEPVPLFFESGKGSKLVDVDGNEYIDYILGQGPDIFGHAPDFLREAVIDGMRRGQMFGGTARGGDQGVGADAAGRAVRGPRPLLLLRHRGGTVRADARARPYWQGQGHQVRGPLPRLDG